jgi:hypothetical protein
LAGNAEFTGTWHVVNGYSEIVVAVYSDVASATNGLIIEHSGDGVAVDDTDVFTIYASTGSPFRIVPGFDYIRVRYINGATPQTRFILSTTFRYNMTAGSTHRADETIRDSSDGPLSIVVPKLRTSANNWVAQSATNAGNAKISLEELETGISDNNKTQLKTSMYAKTGDTTFQVPRLDTITHSLQYVDYAHHEIHSGSSFTVCHTADIGNGANMDVQITTPNTTTWAHLVYEFEGESEFDFNIYEAPTTTGGTTLDIFNRNRNSAATSTLSAVHTPSVSGTGTRINCFHAGSGKTIGGGDRGTHEFILKQNTKYLFRITNSTTNNNYMSLKLDWYEHTNKTA